MRRNFGKVELEIVQGDITKAQVHAVVNAANNHFWMGGGVAGAIRRAGGPEIEVDAIQQGPVEVGEAVVTRGGSLAAGYVIHAAVMGQDLQTDTVKIRRATRNSLERAEELEIESIAFPAFGTGVGGFRPDLSADSMLKECIAFIERGSCPKLKKVVFVLFSPDILAVFESKLRELAPDA